jgi:hypothetical protein
MKLLLTTILLVCANWLQGETLNQLRLRVDTKLTNLFPTLVNRQNNYFQFNNKYWQGLLIFSSLPAHTTTNVADAPADRLTVHPTDQSSSWSDVFPEWNSELFAAGAQIDVYNSPKGKGWILTVFVKHNGNIYQRQKWWGPENNDFDWRLYVFEE